MAVEKKGSIDSPYSNFMGKPAPGVASGGPGHYDEHPDVGPKGENGGIPLKFTDDSIAAPGTTPGGPSMVVSPMPTKG